jgi:hypothetical protein
VNLLRVKRNLRAESGDIQMNKPPRTPLLTKLSASPAFKFLEQHLKWFVMGGLFLCVWIIIIIVGMLLVYQNTSQPLPNISTPSQIISEQILPTQTIQNTDCGEPTLVLGTVNYLIESLARGVDGSISAPPATPGVAYWIEGTDPNYVLVISPAQDNMLGLAELKEGDQATITWANCNSTVYALAAPMQAAQDDSALIDQLDPTAPGISIIVQSSPPNAGMLVKGDPVEEQFLSIPMPQRGNSEIQAEISLLETSTSPDGSTIQVGVSIMNYGQAAFTLSESDVSLTPENSASQAPFSAEPALPRKIKPGASETIYFTFPRPASTTAVFKVFSAEYVLEGY